MAEPKEYQGMPRHEVIAKCERLEQAFTDERRRKEDVFHALLIAGFPTHEEFDRCGCESCDRTRASMLETGYLKPREHKDGDEEG